MLRDSCANYRRVEELFRPLGIPVAVENAGVMDRNNMLLDESGFVSLCRAEGYPVLIDIGHANANGWDLRSVMERLKGRFWHTIFTIMTEFTTATDGLGTEPWILTASWHGAGGIYPSG